MVGYIIRRLIYMFPLLIGITLITFLVMHISPGRPTDVIDFQAKISANAKQKLIQLYGLDKPWYVQYLNWLGRIIKFDFGKSFKDDRLVINKILERLPATILLNICSIGLIFIVAIPIGIISAVKRDSFFDKITTIGVFIGYSIPRFWLALLLMILFGLKMGLLPISGLRSLNYAESNFVAKCWDILKHLFLPVIVSAFGGLAGLSRYMRDNMLEVINQDFIRYAYAKGLAKRTVIYKHALKNALLPVITILGLSLPDLIGGSFIFETIFAYPGIGRLGYEAIMARDYPLIMGIGTIVALLTLLGNFIADITYAYVDPRIRYR